MVVIDRRGRRDVLMREEAMDMPRPRRLDFQGAIHLVRIVGRSGLQIFFDRDTLPELSQPARAASRLRKFEGIVVAACEECGATLSAYRIACNASALLLHVGGSSLDVLMQRICGRYSRYLHTEHFLREDDFPFAGRYESKIISPTYLPHALRRLHSQAPGEYAFSSGAAYLGGRSHVSVDIAAVRQVLKQKGFSGLAGYKAFMAQQESPYVGKLLDRGSPFDSRIVGDRVFVTYAHAAAAHPSAPPTLEQLSLRVARLLQRDIKDLYASTHVAVLGRSLVAWYALRSGAATLTVTGKWFSVSAATLGQGIRHYRRVSPELFNQRALL
jgi:hypothetical protein